jgi:hypothetical protein
MKILTGRCSNDLFCVLGASGRLIQVAADQPFLCPVCAKPLQSAGMLRPRAPGPRGVLGISITLLVLAAFFIGALVAWAP